MTNPPYQPVLVTPDTNVCVSGGTISPGAPSQIIREWRADRLDFALCEQILGELQDVLARPYFAYRVGWKPQQIAHYVNELREGSLIVPATTPVNVSPDPNDNVVFACA